METAAYTNATMGSNMAPTTVWTLYHRYLTIVDILQAHKPEANTVDKALTPIFYIIGILGNTISARIWLDRRMRKNNSSAIYLATLSITDLFFLSLHIPMELKYAWSIPTLDYPGLCQMFFLFYNVGQYLSPILVLAFTVERYIAVCHPFKKEKYCTNTRAMVVVCCLVTFCVLLSCIQAYLWNYDYQTQTCEVRAEVQVGEGNSLWSVWTWVTEALTFFLVPFMILVFNILVLLEVRRLSLSGRAMLPGQPTHHSTSGSSATTVMLLSVSFYVIFTTIPASVVYSIHIKSGDPTLTDEEIRNDPQWQTFFQFLFVRKIVEEICLSHYACNIVLYVITGTQFRQTLWQSLSKCAKTQAQNYRNDRHVEFSQIPQTKWTTAEV